MKRHLIPLLLLTISLNSSAQKKIAVESEQYRRSSIYSILLSHSEREFEKDIMDEFLNIPVPEKYNDHDPNVKVIRTGKSTLSEEEATKLINSFITNNNLASHMVARWYDRNVVDGTCNSDLIMNRGLYNATIEDVRKAEGANVRAEEVILRNTANDLLNSTFLIVNDIHYIDRSKGSSVLGALLTVAGSAMAATEASKGNYDRADTYELLGQTAGAVAASYKGFKCKVNTYLYRLVWDEEAQGVFEGMIYSETPDPEKLENYDKYKSSFRLEYVGMQESSGSNTSFLGINEDQPQLMVRKACQRAIDENIAGLQKHFDVFKVKTPLLQIDDKTFKAEIGLKEGINKNTRFEVLQPQMDKMGNIVYKNVGEVMPASDQIWDNRFMAVEEGATNADLAYTKFKKVKGNTDDWLGTPLIRQIK